MHRATSSSRRRRLRSRGTVPARQERGVAAGARVAGVKDGAHLDAATLKLGARGDLRCSWFDGEPHELKLDRHDFLLGAELFEAVGEALQALPKIVVMSMDDTAHAFIEWSLGDVTRRRERNLTRRPPDSLEREFCRLFDPLSRGCLPGRSPWRRGRSTASWRAA